MAFQPAPFVAKFALNFVANGKPVANILHIKYGTLNPDGADIANDATALADWVTEGLLQFVGTNTVFTDVTGTDISQPDGIQVVALNGTGEAGQRGNNASNNVALVASLRTGFSGRSMRGRTYVAGLAEADITGNFFDEANRDGLEDQFKRLIGIGADPVELNGNLCVLSRVAAGVVRPSAVSTIINQIIVNARVDTQRRRLPK